MRREKDSPLPDAWIHEFMHKADLEKSFRDLDGCRHFHGHTMRGRIRTLQLRTDDAWTHFDRAEAMSRVAEESISNLRRAFVLQVYRFLNALLEDPGTSGVEIEEPSLPKFPSALLDEFPELRAALNLRARVQGVYLLHAGQCEEALDVFRALTEDRRARSDVLANAYLSIACCQFNLGNEHETRHFLEAAELAIHACEAVLNRGYLCGLIYALHDVMDDQEKAAEWKEFLYSLACPRATKDAFLARGEKFVAMCHEHDRLVVF